jgi:hypothetical protein
MGCLEQFLNGFLLHKHHRLSEVCSKKACIIYVHHVVIRADRPHLGLPWCLHASYF